MNICSCILPFDIFVTAVTASVIVVVVFVVVNAREKAGGLGVRVHVPSLSGCV